MHGCTETNEQFPRWECQRVHQDLKCPCLGYNLRVQPSRAPEEHDQDPIEQFTETEAESEDPIELFTDDGSAGGASSSSSSMASGSQQPHHGGEQRFGLEEREMRKERPWDMPAFQDFPYLKASDQWTNTLPGWLIRIHGKKRARLFHPLH